MRNFSKVFAKAYEHLQNNQTLGSKLILYQPLAGNINRLQPFTTCSDNLQQYRPLSAQKPLAKKIYQKYISKNYFVHKFLIRKTSESRIYLQ